VKKINFSVIIIAKDEEEMIGECLESVKWADEIILLDGGSTDKTLEIAKRYSQVKVVSQKVRKIDYGAWHNQGIKETQGRWIFYLDADERLTPESQEEIISNIQYPISNISAFAIPRRNVLLGKVMRFGGWYPDYQIRLFKKSHLEKWEGSLHERPSFKGELGYLKRPMVHLTHRDLSSMVEKTRGRGFLEIESELLFKAGHPPVTWWRILKVMVTEFWLRFIKYQAWRDGTVGWIEGLFQVFNRFLIYARLWELQKQR